MQYDGMLVFQQLGQKVKIGKEYVLQQYVKVASTIPSFPTFPTGGYDAESLYGKWYAYNDLDDCYAFVQACDSHITFIYEGKQVGLKVEVVGSHRR
jgi:hypothetical protein